MEWLRLIQGSKHPGGWRRGKCALVSAVPAFVPPNIHLRAHSTQRETFWEHGSCKCTLSREFRLQASWHHHQQQRQKLFMPRHSSAARSGNLHKWQLMGKRPQCHPSSAPTLQRKGSHSLPQICTAPTVLRQKGPKPAAKNYLRDGRQWQGSSPWNGFIVERLSSLHWWEPYFKAIWPGLQTL